MIYILKTEYFIEIEDAVTHTSDGDDYDRFLVLIFNISNKKTIRNDVFCLILISI
jgi:hypothetical protein